MPRLRQRQPRFASEADRVVQIENRMQAVDPAFLTAVKIGGRSFTLRELQPSADKLDLAAAQPDAAELEAVVWSMGELTAWAQLRSAGRDGAAGVETLMAFAGNAAGNNDVFRRLVDLSRDWSKRIHADWRGFRASPLAKWAMRSAPPLRER
jgi:uncharacterized protein (DUF2252 family)